MGDADFRERKRDHLQLDTDRIERKTMDTPTTEDATKERDELVATLQDWTNRAPGINARIAYLEGIIAGRNAEATPATDASVKA